MNEIVEKVKKIIRPLFDETYYHLVDVELRGSGPSQVLAIYADTDSGITLKEITWLTQQIGDLLDMNDVIPGRYRLEVSSPGIGRPFKYLWQYRKNIGRILNVIYETSPEEKKEVRGTLQSVTEKEITLKVDREEIVIPIDLIIEAKEKLKI